VAHQEGADEVVPVCRHLYILIMFETIRPIVGFCIFGLSYLSPSLSRFYPLSSDFADPSVCVCLCAGVSSSPICSQRRTASGCTSW
jgi:hypothetical protein